MGVTASPFTSPPRLIIKFFALSSYVCASILFLLLRRWWVWFFFFFFAFFVNTRVYTHTEDYARKQLGDIVVTRRSSYTIV